jgi:hypothetical protein
MMTLTGGTTVRLTCPLDFLVVADTAFFNRLGTVGHPTSIIRQSVAPISILT